MTDDRRAAPTGEGWNRRDALLAGLGVMGSVASACTSGSPDPPRPRAGGSTAGPSASGTSTTSRTTTTARRVNWVALENAQPGTPGWQVPPDDPAVYDRIRGFAAATSVNTGAGTQLFVSTEAPSWYVQAFRIGSYGGVGARQVWESAVQPGRAQPPAVRDPATRMVRAPWSPSLEIRADRSWPPGQYLLKLVSSDGGQSFVPLVVRDDTSTADLLVQSSVTTWQAYNEWGGTNLYEGDGRGSRGRADVVSFDRPYYRRGAGELFGREYEFILFAEREGLDVTYWTDVDLHERPERAMHHRAVVSLGHDEYYSTRMRSGLEAARDSGVNLVFLGANACFRKIRLEASALGAARQEVNYRSSRRDPQMGVDPSEVTVDWRQPPSSNPESSLVGNYYESNPVDASMVVVEADSWIFEGSGLRNGDALPHLVGNEFDRVTPSAPTPGGIEVLCHSPVVSRGRRSFSDTTWYTTLSGAGVFASGTLWWIPHLAADRRGTVPSAAQPDAAIQQVTRTLLRVVASGPAGFAHPSVGNLERLGIR